MPIKSLALGRMYNRLAPIARMQWDTAQDYGTRARVAGAVLQLVGADLSLAAMERLRRFAARPVPVYANGMVHYVDIAANEIVPLLEMYGGMYKSVPGFTAGPGQIVVDIGANIGAFTFWQAARGAVVYSYEPNPACFDRLSRAITSNNLEQRVHAFNHAVGALEGRGTLVIPDLDSTAGTLRADPTGTIDVTTLPAIFQRHELTHVDVLKIDAEGSEASILDAGESVLDRVEHLVLECHSTALEQRCRQTLAPHDFVIVDLTMVDPQVGACVIYAARQP